MRSIISFLVLFCLALPARAVDDPATVARLVAAGAPDLAMQLAHTAVLGTQPDPAWRDVYWLAVSKSRQRPDLNAPPPSQQAAPAAWVGYHLALADQAALQEDWLTARAHWAQALWREGITPENRQRAQAGIARSWLAPEQIKQRPEVVNPVVLRFLSDESGQAILAERAALRLLDAHQAKSAGELLGAMAPQSPLRILVQYRQGQLLPEQAEAQMQAQAQGADAVMAWQGLRRLADDGDKADLKVESLEHLLALERDWTHATIDLWQAYFTLAEAAANRQQLLVGMDAQWLEQAKASLAQSPREARALLAWLAHRGGDEGLRVQALEVLADSLGDLASRVLGDAPFALPRATEALRYRLGKQALAAGDLALAAGWWAGLGATAANLPPRAWYLQQAEVNVWTHRDVRAIEWLQLALAQRQALSGDEVTMLLAQANALLQQGHVDAVDQILRQASVLVDAANSSGLWRLRGAVAERRGQWAEAAAHYLLAANSALGNQAMLDRHQAADDLRRAGLLDDAMRQDAMLKAAQNGNGH